MKLLKSGTQVVVAQALPYLLLRARGHPERSEVPRVRRIAEIARHAQLERPPLVRRRIPLPQTAGPQRLARRHDLGGAHSLGEAALELLAQGRRWRGGRDEGESRHPLRVLEQIQYREQPAPGVAAQRQPVDLEVVAHGFQIGDLFPPADRNVARDG